MTVRDTSPRLGRGLASLLGEAPGTRQSAEIRPIPIDLLEPGPHQPRGAIPVSSLDELIASIRARGVLQPLLARPHPHLPGRYEIIAGERRWRAAQAAGLHELPVLIRAMSDAESSASALVENLQRQDLNPIEEALGYRRLIAEFGMTQEALAEAVGKSRSHIANTMRLLNLPPALQAEVRQGALSAGHARALLSHPDPEKAALAVIAGGLNVRQTEALVARQTQTSHADPKTGKAASEMAYLEKRLSERLGLQVGIDGTAISGMVRIRYTEASQLDGIATLLAGGSWP